MVNKAASYDLQGLKNFFFEGSLLGYAGGGEYVKEHSIAGFPEKVFVHQNAQRTLMYMDRYTSNGEYSEGQVKIYHRRDELHWGVIWVMSYHGWCKHTEEHDEDRYISFLKERLLAAYEKKMFIGGRGVNFGKFLPDGLSYDVEVEGEFCSFRDIEQVHERTNGHTEEVLYNHFQGQLLLPH